MKMIIAVVVFRGRYRRFNSSCAVTPKILTVNNSPVFGHSRRKNNMTAKIQESASCQSERRVVTACDRATPASNKQAKAQEQQARLMCSFLHTLVIYLSSLSLSLSTNNKQDQLYCRQHVTYLLLEHHEQRQ
jgi:hypothetical protein